MVNAWLGHVKRTGKENPDVMQKGGFKAILKLAGQTWKKGTGAVSSVVKGTVKGISKVAKTASSTLKMKKKSTRKRKGTKKRKGKKTRGKGKTRGKR
jgi:hypothetical protein